MLHMHGRSNKGSLAFQWNKSIVNQYCLTILRGSLEAFARLCAQKMKLFKNGEFKQNVSLANQSYGLI